MRLLLVDNHDSYTYNLFQLLATVAGTPPTVLTNDAAAWADLDPRHFDAVVVSPGPGRPQHPRDVGHAVRALQHPELPMLGVCLGHQLLAHTTGGDVALAPAPRHGHLTQIRHAGTDLFHGLPQEFTAVRYHSLAASEPLPAELRATAWAEDGVLMGLAHRELPRWGVQFHPESVATEHGRELVANFLDLAGLRPAAAATTFAAAPLHPAAAASDPASDPATTPPATGEAPLADGDRLYWRVLYDAVDTERIFTRLYATEPHAIWLDSSGHTSSDDTARFSFIGAPGGPRAEILTYQVGSPGVTTTDATGTEHREQGTILAALRRRIAAHPRPTPLPFDFAGGYVGYFGYEMKADCGHPHHHTASTPDAVWLRIDRFLAIDHTAGHTYVVARSPDTHPDATAAREWVETIAHTLATADASETRPPSPEPPAPPPTAAEVEQWLPLSREDYQAHVKECLGYLAAGESYELCLTTQLRTPAPADDLAFYRRLRHANPAPYGALLRLGGLTVHSASPERFLRIAADGTIDSRPIKGTAARHADPESDRQAAVALGCDPKTRAENLMIVDLLRNDLGRVCAVGTVTVPEFMYTRSYATVHQLISTVRGRLRPDAGPVDAIAACFPGGSMTGAPKRRTCELLDGLEAGARGVYSGALGYLGYDGGADLSIVIRTAVHSDGELTVGAGGAIVLDSDPAAEYQEMLTKAAVPLRALEVDRKGE